MKTTQMTRFPDDFFNLLLLEDIRQKGRESARRKLTKWLRAVWQFLTGIYVLK